MELDRPQRTLYANDLDDTRTLRRDRHGELVKSDADLSN